MVTSARAERSTAPARLESALCSGIRLRAVPPKVRIVDVALVHYGSRQSVLQITLQADDRTVVISLLASCVGLPLKGLPRVKDGILCVGVSWLRNGRVKLAAANQPVFVRHTIVPD